MKFTAVFTALLGAAGVIAAPVPGASLVRRDPPGVPSASSARSLLSGLRVAAPSSGSGYDRSEFNHWITIENSCNAREMVLIRDGTNVQTGSGCSITSGTWVSPFDSVRTTDSSSIDIDHMVPLREAYVSGAASWSASRKEQFANDLSGPQLWAVSASSNRSKGDRTPDNWAPPTASFRCTYARAWIQVKSTYSLTITSAERTALGSMLDTC